MTAGRPATRRAVAGPRPVVAPAPVVIRGRRSDFDDARPPIIVNPMAEADALMSWGIGQLAAVNQLLAAIASNSAGADGPAIARAAVHLTAQAETAIRAALQVHRSSFME